jgi:3-hydroxybutyryl-CoA dehydrogenase
MLRTCRKCGFTWRYNLSECISCGGKLETLRPKEFTVVGATEVAVASAEHTKVPYYNLLLEDEYGNLHIHKSFKSCRIGERISKKAAESKPVKVAIIGTGITGSGIAEVALAAGCEVIWVSRSEESLKKAVAKTENNLLKSLTEEDTKDILKNLNPTTSLEGAAAADLVIESIVENLDDKKKLFRALDSACGPNAILASNTSSLSIDELAEATKRPEKVVGMHFFNPVPKMHLVEVIRGSKTSDHTANITRHVAETFNKTVIMTRDSPCFIVNRMLMPYLNEAILIMDEGLATKEEIDQAAKLGLNHPMGPLALLDLIGLDVYLNIMNNLHARTGNPKFKPPKTVEKMVADGLIGRKAGEGFYKYT